MISQGNLSKIKEKNCLRGLEKFGAQIDEYLKNDDQASVNTSIASTVEEEGNSENDDTNNSTMNNTKKRRMLFSHSNLLDTPEDEDNDDVFKRPFAVSERPSVTRIEESSGRFARPSRSPCARAVLRRGAGLPGRFAEDG